jgi:hypothetical protein
MMVGRDAAVTDHAATLRRGARSHRGPDRLTVMLLTLAAFLAVFAILAARLQAVPAAPAPPPQVVVLRRVYQTTIVDDGSRNGRGAATTVSVSSSGTAPTTAPAAAPTTRTSSHP